jgi:phenylpropionate dioxygenase-like ring-hydroxylating dioxygenase large terminal subunit
MIINNWYVACESSELGEQPLPVRMLGCDFVLFRDHDGAAACLSAVCCHRGGDLSRGKRVDGCVQCPYHGWQFDAAGRCKRMPPLGDDVQPPKRARVDAYPVQERYGYVWAFLGDLPESGRPELPDFLSEYSDATAWRIVRLKRDWNANWARVHENLLDTSHLYLVHSFGRHLPSKMKIWPTEKTALGGRVVQCFASKPTAQSTTEANRAQAAQTRPESVVTLEFSIVGLMHKNTQQMASGYDQVIWNCLTPVDAGVTRNFGLHLRNSQLDPKHDEAMRRTILYGLKEDAAVVENLKPKWTPASTAAELWMATDAMERVYRDQAGVFRHRLGEIDARRLQDLSRDRVLVIPSPARRSDPGGWVHETVPLIRAEASGDE